MMTRRHALKATALVAASVAALPGATAQPSPDLSPSKALLTATPIGPFTLPALPYAVDALEPHLDARTMEIHHDKHHKAYVDNLNKAVAEFPEWAQKPVDEMLAHLATVPEKNRTAVRNNGGGHFNHSLFWQMMSKSGGGEPKGELAKAIDANFGSFSTFKENFAKAGLTQFGSGWAWLVSSNGKLAIESSPNQDTPLGSGKPPLLGLDVWEHAYYLKYQNKRADYIAAWWNVVNWDFVAERYAKFKG